MSAARQRQLRPAGADFVSHAPLITQQQRKEKDMQVRRTVEKAVIENSTGLLTITDGPDKNWADRLAAYGLIFLLIAFVLIGSFHGLGSLGERTLLYGRDFGAMAVLVTCIFGFHLLLFIVGILWQTGGRIIWMRYGGTKAKSQSQPLAEGREAVQLRSIAWAMTLFTALLVTMMWVISADVMGKDTIITSDDLEVAVVGEYDSTKSARLITLFVRTNAIYVLFGVFASFSLFSGIPLLSFFSQLRSENDRPWTAEGSGWIQNVRLGLKSQWAAMAVYGIGSLYGVVVTGFSFILATHEWDSLVPNDMLIADLVLLLFLLTTQLLLLVFLLYGTPLMSGSYRHSGEFIRCLALTVFLGAYKYYYYYHQLGAYPNDHDLTLATNAYTESEQAAWLFMNAGLFSISIYYMLANMSAFATFVGGHEIPLTQSNIRLVESSGQAYRMILSGLDKARSMWWLAIPTITFVLWIIARGVINLVWLGGGYDALDASTWRWVDFAVTDFLGLLLLVPAGVLLWRGEIGPAGSGKQMFYNDKVVLWRLILVTVLVMFVMTYSMFNLHSGNGINSRKITTVDVEVDPDPTLGPKQAITTRLLFHVTVAVQLVAMIASLQPLLQGLFLALMATSQGKAFNVTYGMGRDVDQLKKNSKKAPTDIKEQKAINSDEEEALNFS